jgi:hypothetical protein
MQVILLLRLLLPLLLLLVQARLAALLAVQGS